MQRGHSSSPNLIQYLFENRANQHYHCTIHNAVCDWVNVQIAFTSPRCQSVVGGGGRVGALYVIHLVLVSWQDVWEEVMACVSYAYHTANGVEGSLSLVYVLPPLSSSITTAYLPLPSSLLPSFLPPLSSLLPIPSPFCLVGDCVKPILIESRLAPFMRCKFSPNIVYYRQT